MSASALATALALACVRFEDMPEMPPASANHPSVYASSAKPYARHVSTARLLVRSANVSWVLRGTAGEVLASTREIRERFGGIMFVGDSQIREIAWAALQMLTPGQHKRFFKGDKVFARQRPLGESACVPQSIGKTGFTASCGRLAGARGNDGAAEPCELHSPFQNKSHAETMRKLLLTKPHLWDGKLSVSESVCESDFFLAYAATWGAMPIEPTTLPSCLHPQAAAGGGGGDEYALQHKRLGVRKPVLWIIDGCGLHEMEFCDARRWSLPQSVLPRFPAGLLSSGTVVWQTVGAGFLMKAARRFKGECSDINSDMVAAKEAAWLQPRKVRVYNYTSLALQYAPLMFDAIHFTYYWVPCSYTFPEMARLVAQLAFQQAVGRPVEVCPAGYTAPPTAAAPTSGNGNVAYSLGEPGGSSVSLAQTPAQTAASYSAALRLAGKAEPGKVAKAAHGKGEHSKGEHKGGHGKGGHRGKVAGPGVADEQPAPAGVVTPVEAAAVSGRDKPPAGSDAASGGAAASTAASSAAGGSATPATSTSGGSPERLASAIHKLALEFGGGGGKKRTHGAEHKLEAAIEQLAKRYGAHD